MKNEQDEIDDDDFVCPDCNGSGEVECVNLGEDSHSAPLPCPTCIAREIAERDAQTAATIRQLQAQLAAETKRADEAWDKAIEAAAKCCDELGAEEQKNLGLGREAQNYYRARDAIRVLKKENTNGQ